MRPEGAFGVDRAVMQEELASVFTEDRQAPWFVRGLVAISAWIASLMFLVFMYGTNIITSSEGAIAFGAALTIGAVLLRRSQGKVPFFAQLALALSLSGQALVVFGIGDETHFAGAALGAIGLSAALIIFYPDKTHRFLSTLIAVGAAWAFVYDRHVPYGAHVLIIGAAAAAGHVWHYESSLAAGKREQLVRPLAYGLITGLFLLLIPTTAPPHIWTSVRSPQTWFPVTLVLAVLLLLLEYRILSFHKVFKKIRLAALAFLGTLVLALASLRAPGIIAALFVLTLGFHRGNKILVSLALAFLAVFLSAYYYNLDITLINKSYTLLAVGAALLVLRFFWTNVLGINEKEESHE
jgi:hypothetical protein